MIKSLRATLALLALCAASGWAAAAGSSAAVAGRQGPPAVGGYRAVSVEDPGVVAAAHFAVAEQGRKTETSLGLVSIEAAGRQTVAGANYKLCMQVGAADEDGDVEAAESVLVVVHQSLKREYTLRSWRQADCAPTQ